MAERLRPYFKLAGALAVSIAIAAWASRRSAEGAINGWLLANPPAPVIWETALAAKGVERCRDPLKIHRALRTLPASLDQIHRVWCADGCGWVAIALESDELTVFARDCGSKPEAWAPRGLGWAAFPGVLAEIQPRAPVFRPAARDPREIRY